MEDMGVARVERERWRGRGVLVTGAAGFLGRVTATQLAASGARVVGLDIDWHRLPQALIPAGISVVDGDVRDGEGLRTVIADGSVDTVIHLAAQTLVGPALVEPAATFSHNVEGTWALLDACREHGGLRAIVVASSDKAYGDYAGRPYREDMALRADHPYDVSKAAADLIARSYAATYRLPIAVTRCGNLYGGGDLNWSRVVPGTIRSILQGEPPVVRSDGTLVRDYLHVGDAAEGTIRLAAELRKNPALNGVAFNLSTGVRLAVLDVVERVLDLMQSNLEPVLLARELQELPAQRVSSARARRILGWRPVTTFEAGLREAIDWYRQYLPLLS